MSQVVVCNLEIPDRLHSGYGVGEFTHQIPASTSNFVHEIIPKECYRGVSLLSGNDRRGYV